MARLTNKVKSYKNSQGLRKKWKRKIILSFEGAKTEPSYFNNIRNYFNKFDQFVVDINITKRKEVGRSHPKNVLEDTKEYYINNKQMIDHANDFIIMVIDVDEHFDSNNKTKESTYNEFLLSLKIDDQIKINLCISNRSFEFWELLQFMSSDDAINEMNNTSDIKKRLKELYFENKNITFIDKTLNAITNYDAGTFCKDYKTMVGEVGTNIGELIKYLYNETKDNNIEQNI